MRPRRSTVFLVLVTLAVVSIIVLLRRTSDTPEEPAELAGRLWVEEGEGEPLLVHLIEEERRRVSRSGRHSLVTKTRYYTRYSLVARQLADGAVVGCVTLDEVERNSARPKPELLGVADGRAWLWNGTLTAYTVPDLTKTFSHESWGARAAAVAELLPPNAEGFRIAPNRRELTFRGRDARLYRVDAEAGDVAEINPELFPPTTLSRQVEDRFVHYRPPQMSRVATSLSNLTQKSFGAPDGYWYALLSESERKGLGRWISIDNRPYGDVARSFYRLPYQWDGRHAAIDSDRIETLGDVRLIQAGFLERDFFKVWTVPDPESALALARPRLGPDVPWELLRLAHDGRIVWQTTTGLAEVYGYLPTARHVVLVGQRLPVSISGVKGDRREYAVTIDTTTGASHLFDVGDGTR